MSQQHHIAPPKWPLRFMRIFVKKEYLEEIEGDMEELFRDHLEQQSITKAKRMYTWEMLRLLRPILIKNLAALQHLNHYPMFKNYFKTSLRSLIKSPLSSFINIFGLSVAIGICVVVYAFIDYAYSIDGFHENKNKVYLTTIFVDREGAQQQYGIAPRPLGEMLKQDFVHIKKVCRLEDKSVVLKYEDKIFNEQVRFADPEFLEMFTFPLKEGLSNSLSDISAIILSEDMAKKYFGDENPMGREMVMVFGENNSKAFTVTGVAEAFPKAHAIHFDFLINFGNVLASDPGYDLADWKAFVTATLIQVDGAADLASIEKGMEKYRALQNQAEEDWAISSFVFVSLADLYTQSGSIRNDISINPPLEAQIALPIIGIFMLALACFNYINIAIVSAAKRVKEIGVRKVIGASRAKVIVQFLSENILITFFAGVIGLILAATIFLPWFIQLSSKPLELTLTDQKFWIYLLTILLFTGIASGLYPAFYVSRFEAVKIFKGSLQFGKKNQVTKTFLGFQLILACILITGAVMFTQNTAYQGTRDWGYSPDEVLFTPVPNRSAFEPLRDAMIQNSNVLSISGSSHHLGKSNATSVVRMADRQYEVHQFAVDASYFDAMGLRLKEGRVFNNPTEGDKHAVVVNELFVKNMMLEQPVGEVFEIDSTRYEVIGVVSDFHSDNFYHQMLPSIFTVANQQDYQFLSMRVKNGSQKETLEALKAKWATLLPDIPFQGGYQKDVWGRFFQQVDTQENFSKVVAMIAVMLASLGLYGLVTLNVSGRVKEFSIRKVLGATLNNIAATITRQYLILAIVAMVLGAPLSYLLITALISMMYAYPLPVSYSGVAISVTILILILLATVSTQVIKVAKSNPVSGLKE